MFGMIFKTGRAPVHFKIKFVDIASFIRSGEIEFCIPVFQLLFTKSGLIILIGIGPEMKPDKAEGIGGVIDVFELFEAGEAVVDVIKRNVDGIVDFLLPVTQSPVASFGL